MAHPYTLTPLPTESTVKARWLILWSMLVIFSPFIGFAIHGRVEEGGFRTGLMVAILPLSALAYLAIRRWRVVRLTPRHILDEWRFGKLVPADGAPLVSLPARFAKGKYWIEIRSDGIVLSSKCFLGMQGWGPRLATLRTVEQSGQLFVPWDDVEEWIVNTDSDGPDYYCLKSHSRRAVLVRRFHPKAACECELLDAVRRAGNVSVRLHCDIACP